MMGGSKGGENHLERKESSTEIDQIDNMDYLASYHISIEL